MYEHHSKRLLPLRLFLVRLGKHLAVVAALMAASLGLGMAGYVYLAHLGRVDAFLNAAMLLGGMGPVNELHSNAAKIFAGVMRSIPAWSSSPQPNSRRAIAHQSCTDFIGAVRTDYFAVWCIAAPRPADRRALTPSRSPTAIGSTCARAPGLCARWPRRSLPLQ